MKVHSYLYPWHLLGALALFTSFGASCTTMERSLIFATETSQGLNVSVGGQTTEPIKLSLGYKRWEGVMNPVYDKNGIDSSGQKYRDEAYSVIAKFAGEITAGASTTGAGTDGGPSATGAIVASQWFATGEAATWLAKHSETAAILSDNPAVTNALRGLAASGSPAVRTESILILRAVNEFLKLGQTDSDTKLALRADIAEAREDLDAALSLVPAKYPVTLYGDYDAAATALPLVKAIDTDVRRQDFDSLITYYAELQVSAKALNDAKAAATDVQITSAGALTTLPQATVKEAAGAQEEMRAGLEKQILTHPAVVSAFELVVRILTKE